MRNLLALSKPRVIGLLVFTGACGVFKAADGSPPLVEIVTVIVAGTLAAAGANAINQGLDADIDAVMSRTRFRPVPSNVILPSVAMLVGGLLVAGAVGLMLVLTNWIAALLMLLAAVVYVFVYTVALKRHSWNNIVIGGAAGAFPPLIGAASVTATIDAVGIYMFAFIFFWTPPHFWTLSILLRDDYAAAKVPMLPTLASPRAIGWQVVLYITLLVALAWLPVVSGYGGIMFATAVTVLSLQWIRKSRPLFDSPSHQETLSAYKYSLLYLAAAFLVLAFEPVLSR